MLPLESFAKKASNKDGRQERCRECFSAYNKRRYEEKKESIKKRIYAYREENPRSVFESRLKTCLKNPSRTRANKVIEAALAAGIITNPGICFGCGCDDAEHRIEAHHHDYSKPLDVVWLCTPCHRQMDAQRRLREGKAPYGRSKSHQQKAS